MRWIPIALLAAALVSCSTASGQQASDATTAATQGPAATAQRPAAGASQDTAAARDGERPSPATTPAPAGSPRQRPAAAPAASCGVADAADGLVPLTDLGAASYGGFAGGLYPNGSNVPPPTYLEEGLAMAEQITPRSAGGQPDANGKIVLLSIGMSNTTQEFSDFAQMAQADPARASSVVVVDGAQGGQDAETIKDASARFWQVVDQRLAAAGTTRQQVQAVWLKEAIARENRAFPADARALQADLAQIVGILTDRFPNLRIVYLSSRTYAGYASTSLNPEPHAYDSAFAVKWLIEERIRQPGVGPWLAWGPYLWTAGAEGRGDGLTWTCGDVRDDGTHPSPSGQQKVGALLLDFFKTDPTARRWFVK